MAIIPAPVRMAAIDSGRLDDTYGVAILPQRMDDLEKSLPPRSLHQLGPESALLLERFMKVTEEGLGVTQFVYCELPILWVIDQSGAVWFSIEEVVRSDTKEFVFPRIRNTRVADVHQRLGHPALLGGAGGRIGGEILYDVSANQPGWYITNGSGRYGLRPGRSSSHLANAARIFQDFGIQIREYFIPPEEA